MKRIILCKLVKLSYFKFYNIKGDNMFINALKAFIKRTPLSYIFIFFKSLFVKPTTQNDEAPIIEQLINRYQIPKSFIEFGFSGWEFNCADLASTWKGLLLDGDLYNIKIARVLWKSNISLRHTWLTLENINIFEEWLADNLLGILSVDVDGNDYWFIEALLYLQPAILIAEYNSQLGSDLITVPYDPFFDRAKKHSSRAYFGASLAAITNLASERGYSLINVTDSGVNAFFIRNDLLQGDDISLDPNIAFKKKTYPDGSPFPEQWDLIKDMEYISTKSSS
jgi:hypothetical protein